MRKIKLKLNNREFNTLIFYIETVTGTLGATPVEKLIDACLAELLLKLRVAQLMVQDEYVIKLSMPHAMALLAFYTTDPSHNVTMLKITGIIDQKTA
jgi:hypothetical protein